MKNAKNGPWGTECDRGRLFYLLWEHQGQYFEKMKVSENL